METSEKDKSEFGNHVYNNMMELFFNPEINRRKEQKQLPNHFTLVAAQAIFFPDGRPHIVRLNEEVSAEVKLKKGTDKNVNDFWPSTADVEYIKLNESEFLNCGHSTLILFKDGFQIWFDFHYNKQIAAEHLSVAEEFLKTSKYALVHDLLSAFIDNAFSAVELLAKINLLIEANGNVLGKTHKTIKSVFNQRFKNAQSEFEISRTRVLNQLTELRGRARYLQGSVTMSSEEMKTTYDTIEGMFHELCRRVKLPGEK